MSSSPKQSEVSLPQSALQLIEESIYWLSRSERLQALADSLEHPKAKRDIIRIAESYLSIAEDACERARRELELD
jgi:hypothetical protein